MNRRSQVYSSRAWAVPQGKAQGINRDTLQLISTLSTEKFFWLAPVSAQQHPLFPSLSQGQHSLREGVGWGLALPLCQAPACPHTGQGRGAKEQQRPRQEPLLLQKPSRGESGHAAGAGVQPSSPQTTSSGDPQGHGERKRARTLLGAGASPAVTARQGRGPCPAPTPPRRAGSSLEREEQLCPRGQCPAGWAGTIFCLKRKRYTQRKISKGPSPPHPHTNRFI